MLSFQHSNLPRIDRVPLVLAMLVPGCGLILALLDAPNWRRYYEDGLSGGLQAVGTWTSFFVLNHKALIVMTVLIFVSGTAAVASLRRSIAIWSACTIAGVFSALTFMCQFGLSQPLRPWIVILRD